MRKKGNLICLATSILLLHRLNLLKIILSLDGRLVLGVSEGSELVSQAED